MGAVKILALLSAVFFSTITPSAWGADGDKLWPSGLNAGGDAMASDLNGGAITVQATGSGYVFARRFDQTGQTLWGPIYFTSGDAESSTACVVSDGAGGGIIAWLRNTPSYQVFAQRISPNGTLLWSNPVQISQAADYDYVPKMSTDGTGGAYILFGPRVAHIDSSGSLLGPGQGGIDTGTGDNRRDITADGTGSAIITWENYNHDIVAQKVNTNLNLVWGSSPRLVSDDPRNEAWPSIAQDGSGGVLITWHAYYIYPGSGQVRVQRLDTNGNSLWTTDGVVVVDSTVVGGSQTAWWQYGVYPAVTSDGSGGAIIAWGDWRNDPTGIGNDDIYVQRVNSSGTPLWQTNGVQLGIYTAGSQRNPRVVSDRQGGAVVAWDDKGGYSWDISASRLSSSGGILWQQYVYTDFPANPGTTEKLSALFYDASGPPPIGAIVGWSPGSVQKIQIGSGQRPRIHVTPEGYDFNDGSSWALSKRTIVDAIFAAKPGTEIWVKGGPNSAYHEHLYLDKPVMLYGGFMGTELSLNERPPFPRPSPDPLETIIAGDHESWGVRVFAGLDATTTIDGFTIIDGQTTFGGGIGCFDSSPTISNNVIRGKHADEGGGIYLERSSAQIRFSTISENTATNRGGGIHCHDRCYPYILGNLIASNTTATGDGGGIFCDSGLQTISHNSIGANVAGLAGGGIRCWVSNANILNNLLAWNAAQYGGGIHLHYSTGSIINNTIVDSIVTVFGGGIDCYESTPEIADNIVAFNVGGIYGSGAMPTLHNNNVFGNLLYQYWGPSPGISDISVDPMFVNADAANWHLSAGSQCINKGWNNAPALPTVDIDNEPRVNEGTVDIGCDERSSVPAQTTSLSAARAAANGTSTEFSGDIVSAAFNGFLYVQAEDRHCGIRVNRPGHLMTVGQKANVLGVVKTNADGERYIEATWISGGGNYSVAPLGMTIRSLGGGDWLYNAGTGVGQSGVYQGCGLNNIGLLTRISGIVREKGSNYFLLSDGTTAQEDTGPMEVRTKVLCPPGVTVPNKDAFVSVTGVSSCMLTDGKIRRLVRVRTSNDIQVR
ncbi:MAG: DUF1565 domain-containing protein [Armatimonadetes bacterium]|nr:DUF1565 domain-containing protein [Armatimonadota bacterium]